MIKAKQSSSRFIIHCLLNCLCEGRISEWGFQTSPKIKNKTQTLSLSRETPEKTVFFFLLVGDDSYCERFYSSESWQDKLSPALFLLFSLTLLVISFCLSFFPSKRGRVVQWEVKRRRVRTAREKTTPLAEKQAAAEDQS